MITTRLRYLLSIQLLFTPALGLGETDSPQSFPVPGHGALRLSVPASWQHEIQQPPDKGPPTVVFRPRSGAAFQVLVTLQFPPRPGVALPSLPEMRAGLDRALEPIRPQAVEKDIPIREIKGASGVGCYFRVTDKAPKPGEYRFLTQGMVRVDPIVAMFTILTNDGGERIVYEALRMLEQATHAPDRGG